MQTTASPLAPIIKQEQTLFKRSVVGSDKVFVVHQIVKALKKDLKVEFEVEGVP